MRRFLTEFTCDGCGLSTWSMFDVSGKPHIECIQGTGHWQKPAEQTSYSAYTVAVNVLPDCPPETLQALSDAMSILIEQIERLGLPANYNVTEHTVIEYDICPMCHHPNKVGFKKCAWCKETRQAKEGKTEMKHQAYRKNDGSWSCRVCCWHFETRPSKNNCPGVLRIERANDEYKTLAQWAKLGFEPIKTNERPYFVRDAISIVHSTVWYEYYHRDHVKKLAR